MADKFGNIAVMRLPQSVSDDVDEDPTGNKALWDRGEELVNLNNYLVQP